MINKGKGKGHDTTFSHKNQKKQFNKSSKGLKKFENNKKEIVYILTVVSGSIPD